MRLHAPEPRNIPDIWPTIRERVASCCGRSGGKYEPVDVLLNFLGGRMELWLVLDEADAIQALVITEIVAYPRIRVCKLLACTGEGAPQWLDLIEKIEAWAKARGCGAMEPICRAGWERRLKPLGYRKTHVVLEKSL